ncbi:hypothetical protein [Primorskyibacter sp. 2E233]|uniref:hypothetical protein n=1 Tax=Primorskyibacter sp. 2E233 TaxID=3413431 RepID=UPI003BF16E89
MFRPHFTLSAALLASTCLAGLAQAQSIPEITRIELGQAGIARYTMTAETTGNLITFTVPKGASSDVLASLVVRDPAGGVVDLQTETPGSATAALRETAFAAGIPTDTPSLLAALTGQTVTLTTSLGSTTGQVMGLRRFDAVEDGQRVDRMAALLLNQSGVAEVVLSPGTKVGFSEAAARHLAEAMASAQNRDDSRRFDLTLEAESPRSVDLSYVTEAAAWKNSWRLLLDEGRLQGWATFENVSGAGWDDVQLTLTTGAPVAYRRDLIDPLFIARNESDDTAPKPITAKADNGVTGLMNLYNGTAQSESRTLRPMPAPPSGSASEAAASNDSGILRYTLPETVDLENGRTANLMYLDLPIEPEIRGLYRATERSRTLLLAASITADQPLASGLVSVQDADGFVGDAPFQGMLADQTRLLPFASVSGGAIHTDSQAIARLTSIVHQEGILTLELLRTRTTTYSGALPEMVDLFTVEHPIGYGALDSSNGTAERGDGFYRVTVPVADGTGTVRLVEKETVQKQVRLGAGDFGSLLAEIEAGQIELSQDYRAAFDQASRLKTQFEAAQREVSSVRNRYSSLVGEQERLRENLESVTQEALRNRYLTALDKTETEIANSFDRIDQLETRMSEIEQQVLAVFAAL